MAIRVPAAGLRIASAATLAAALLCAVSPARAGDACDGSIQATSLRPLPSPVVLAIQATRTSPQEEKVRTRFADALQAAGVSVQPHADATMRVSFLVTAMDGGRPRQYTDFSWATGPGAAPLPPIITMTITVSDPAKGTLLWVASLQCRIKTRDPEALATQIGQVIGQTLGSHINDKSF